MTSSPTLPAVYLMICIIRDWVSFIFYGRHFFMNLTCFDDDGMNFLSYLYIYFMNFNFRYFVHLSLFGSSLWGGGGT